MKKLTEDAMGSALTDYYEKWQKQQASKQKVEKATKELEENNREVAKAWDAIQTLRRDATVLPVTEKMWDVPIKPVIKSPVKRSILSVVMP